MSYAFFVLGKALKRLDHFVIKAKVELLPKGNNEFHSPNPASIPPEKKNIGYLVQFEY